MASPPVSPSLTRTTSTTDSTRNLSPTTTWTSEQETRLTYCQDQLKQAQKKWSDRQELWIREVEHLLELKRAHKKAQKKQKARGEKTLRRASTKMWKPLSRTQSHITDTTASTASTSGNNTTTSFNDDDDDDDDRDDDEDFLVGAVQRSDSLPQQISTPSSPTSPSPTQTTGRNPFKKMIRRMSSASVRGSKGRGDLCGGS